MRSTKHGARGANIVELTAMILCLLLVLTVSARALGHRLGCLTQQAKDALSASE